MKFEFAVLPLLVLCLIIRAKGQFDEEFQKIKNRLTSLEEANESYQRNQIVMEEKIRDQEEKLAKISNQKWTMDAIVNDVNTIEFKRNNVSH